MASTKRRTREVGDFGQYLLHPENRKKLSFQLREDGYAPERPKFPASGWNYRRHKIRYERALEKELAIEQAKGADRGGHPARSHRAGRYGRLRLMVPRRKHLPRPDCRTTRTPHRPPQTAHQIDPLQQQSTGIILGVAVCSQRMKDQDGEVRDFFFCHPGDDVKITIPTAGSPPSAASTTWSRWSTCMKAR